ncbi:hypothetical protein B0H10DRAFT_2050153 [Mycena sp. CBHHK59/15]|nr:hypothetical protein B0H10DRAFT_2050153 [Mycena sp. CBHHK59/15]
MANNRNELSHRTTRNAKRHTSTMEKAKRANAGNNKIKELKAELSILIAESKTSSSGVVRVTQKSKAKSLSIASPLFHIVAHLNLLQQKMPPVGPRHQRRKPQTKGS